MKKLLALLTILIISSLFTITSSSSQINVGLSCEQQIKVCQQQISAIQTALIKVSEHCKKTGAEGCQNAIQNLESRLRKVKVDCGRKIQDACS